ncbi:MAG: M56 family metallopeptidase [Muribaculaceae bacterium]|nr:M56 family metallopeptidase [Muribaculaceae bacterium]
MNRRILLIIYAVSLTMPLAILAIILHSPNYAAGISNVEIGEISNEIAGGVSKTGFVKTIGIIDLIYKIYLFGLFLTAAYFLYGLLMLSRLIKRGEKTVFGNFTLILVADNYRIAPFSWRDCIVMRRSDYEEDGDMILIHEYAHLKLLHWSDLLMAYLTICLQWYNPAAWAIREELKAIHEYQADETVIESGVDTKEYQLLLLKRAVGSGYQSFANSLNHSKLQKRVTMMYEKKTSLRRKLFALALIPAIGAGIAVTAIPSVAGVLESLANASVSTPAPSSSETSAEAPAPAKDKTIYVAVEENAEYPGGMDGLFKFMQNNIRYPEAAMKNNVQGRVIVKFVVDADGTVSDAEVVKGVDEDLNKEALRVVNAMPKWTPAKVGGKAVASYFTMPVNFRLNDDSPKEEANK